MLNVIYEPITDAISDLSVGFMKLYGKKNIYLRIDSKFADIDTTFKDYMKLRNNRALVIYADLYKNDSMSYDMYVNTKLIEKMKRKTIKRQIVDFVYAAKYLETMDPEKRRQLFKDHDVYYGYVINMDIFKTFLKDEESDYSKWFNKHKRIYDKMSMVATKNIFEDYAKEEDLEEFYSRYSFDEDDDIDKEEINNE